MRPLRISALVAASSRAWPLSRPCLLAKSSRLSCTLYSQQRWHDGATTYRREETGKLDEVQYGMPVHVVTEDLTDLSWRAWLKFLLIGGAGLYAGAEMAVHGSQILSMMGLYTYVPDDDDDEDEGGESLAAALHDRAETNAATQEKELASIFGDYRVNLSYNWTGNDVSFLTLARDKVTQALASLEFVVETKKPEGLYRKEAELLQSFLKENLKILDTRIMEANKQSSVTS